MTCTYQEYWWKITCVLDPKLPFGYIIEFKLEHFKGIVDIFVAEKSSVESKRECKAESKVESNEESKLETDCRKGIIQLVLLTFTSFCPVFLGFFISKLSSLTHGILIHQQFLMLLTFIFLFVDKFYIYWELILISCLEYKVLR